MVGILQFAKNLFGSSNEQALKKLYPLVSKINQLEPFISNLSDEQLQAKTGEFKARLDNGETLDSLLCEVFAVVRETAKRIMGMRPFDVQILGGIVLHKNCIAQMKTGEGKTLMSTMPVYLNALAGKGVHVVTVNDYLAKRDAENMGRVYSFLGLTTGVITNDLDNTARREAYNCDITYATNNELGFDYLRDNMVYEKSHMVQRGHHYAIIDEIDSILIDEARTPLIISGPLEDKTEFYQIIDKFIPSLVQEDFDIDEKQRTAIFTEIGAQKIEDMLHSAGYMQGDNLYNAENAMLLHHVNNALRAHKLFHKDKDYIVRNGEIVIIDEFTGRMMSGRRYSDGLHQALEAKEFVPIQPESQTLASITFQNYFRMYKKLAGMTGTATTEAEEFHTTYKLDVIDIPTNLPVRRNDEHDEIYATAEEKYAAIVEEIKRAHQREQPILIGTTSIEKSEYLAQLLKKNKIKNFQVLNAKYHEQEAHIIAQAGVPGSITIATNMAGRGTDIQLGGNLEMKLDDAKKANNGEDLAPDKIEEIKENIRINKEKALKAGGLYVLATERHESRRIDNQLRGRSGRQGDPGKSKFYLSLEDDLMRIFGSEKLQSMLQKLGLQAGEAITHPWISKALEKAQKKVEARNYDIRKNLLKYDDVMNDQRHVIFEQRHEVLKADDIDEIINDMCKEAFETLLENYIPEGSFNGQWKLTELSKILEEDFALSLPLENWAEQDGTRDEDLREKIIQSAMQKLKNQEMMQGSESTRLIERMILLQSIDNLWRSHLMNLDHLRSVVGFRGYAQRDPLNEYKTESFMLFQNLISRLHYDVASRLMKQDLGQYTAVNLEPSEMHLEHPNINDEDEETTPSNMPNINRAKIGRNEPCPCNSGKKYKHCHGAFN